MCRCFCNFNIDEVARAHAFDWFEVNEAEIFRSTCDATAISIAAEIIDAYNNTGSVVKKKEEMHKMAQANRAFAHLRW